MSAWGWQAALTFTLAAVLTLGVLISIAVALFRRWHRANYIPRSKIDRAYRTGQFALPYSQRDFK